MTKLRPTLQRKAVHVLGIALLIVVVTLPLVSNALSVPRIKGIGSLSQTVALSTDWDQRGYLGGFVRIIITVRYGSASVGVPVTTRSNAHIALAAALFATYNNVIHKFRSFGGNLGLDIKNGCTLFNWECYHFKVLSKSTRLEKQIGPDKWLRIKYNVAVLTEVIHQVNWFSIEIKCIKLTANPTIIIPPDAYSRSVPKHA